MSYFKATPRIKRKTARNRRSQSRNEISKRHIAGDNVPMP